VDFGFDLRYYILLLRRRWLYILLPFLVVFGAVAAVSVALTPVYRSTGTILVESQQIPDTLIRSTITNVAGERIGVIIQRVMTRANILQIAEKHNLAVNDGASAGEPQIADTMQKAIVIEPVVDEMGGQRNRAGTTMAFTVSFEHRNPETAVAVATDLVSLFLRENVKNRTIRAAETTKFLRQEAEKLQVQVVKIENQIAQFKEQHRDSLPDRLNLNLAALERFKTNLEDTKKEVQTIQAERRLLDIQLAAAKSGLSFNSGPYSTQGERLMPAQELAQLQAALLEKSAVYDQAHPDIVSLKRKISALKGQYKTETSDEEIKRRLYELKAGLKEARSGYSPEHPDVKRLLSEIKQVEAQLFEATQSGASGAARGGDDMINPIYAHVQAQIEAADGRTSSLRNHELSLQKKINEVEAIIAETPMIERALTALNRDYQNAVRKYDEIKAKEMEAQLAENLEEDKQAERLTLIEPPIRPDAPVKPNRLKILAFGLVLALAAGGGGFLLAESTDGSIRGASGYRATFKSSPYIVIPYIATVAETRRQEQINAVLGVSLVVFAVVAIVAFHLFVKRLDILILRLLERLA
jgi:uncharacterized protein involved in exopolysaccharide biosynthesis